MSSKFVSSHWSVGRQWERYARIDRRNVETHHTRCRPLGSIARLLTGPLPDGKRSVLTRPTFFLRPVQLEPRLRSRADSRANAELSLPPPSALPLLLLLPPAPALESIRMSHSSTLSFFLPT